MRSCPLCRSPETREYTWREVAEMHGVRMPCSFVVPFWNGVVSYRLLANGSRCLLFCKSSNPAYRADPAVMAVVFAWFVRRLRGLKWRKRNDNALVLDEEVGVPAVIYNEARRSLPRAIVTNFNTTS